MATKIPATAHHKSPERRKRARRVFPDRRATRCGEPDRRGGSGRRRDDQESLSVREVVSTSEPRRVTDVKVFAYDGTELAKCGLRHISVDGAFIETKSFPLTKGTNLELVLKIRSGGKPTHCRLPAEVIRVEEDGAALMFGRLDEHLYNVLLDIVNSR